MRSTWMLIAMAASVGACTSSDHNAASTSNTSVDELVANAEVSRVVDGDTIDVVVDGREERVRLIGIDTPETKRPDTPIECFGPEATAFTESLLPAGTSVRIERDVVGRDDYGRLLGYVHRAADGLFVNDVIIRQGYARPLTIPPNDTFAVEFARAATEAERADLGLWAACSR